MRAADSMLIPFCLKVPKARARPVRWNLWSAGLRLRPSARAVDHPAIRIRSDFMTITATAGLPVRKPAVTESPQFRADTLHTEFMRDGDGVVCE